MLSDQKCDTMFTDSLIQPRDHDVMFNKKITCCEERSCRFKNVILYKMNTSSKEPANSKMPCSTQSSHLTPPQITFLIIYKK